MACLTFSVTVVETRTFTFVPRGNPLHSLKDGQAGKPSDGVNGPDPMNSASLTSCWALEAGLFANASTATRNAEATMVDRGRERIGQADAGSTDLLLRHQSIRSVQSISTTMSGEINKKPIIHTASKKPPPANFSQFPTI